MVIDYEIRQIIPKIFAIKIEDGYQRAMLFLRSQEHYESAFPSIKNNHFDVFEFMEIYRKWKKLDYFSYPDDWGGFNVPGHIVENCVNHVLDARNGLFPTPYDYIMKGIMVFVKRGLNENDRYYLIGVDKFKGRTMDHEIAHGLYYVNDMYRDSVSKLILEIPKTTYTKMRNIILDMGYAESVIDDEIQAYLSTGLTSEMSKIKGINKIEKIFIANFKHYKNI